MGIVACISRPSGRSLARIWEQESSHLIGRAMEARERAQVHRPFRVGAAALVETDTQLVIIDGANRKVLPGYDPERRCAEMEIMSDALLIKAKRIVGFTVYAPFQKDDATCLDCGVLLTCGHCRNDFRTLMDLGLLVTPDVFVASTNAETGLTLEFTVGEILEMCGGPNDPAITTLPYNFSHLVGARDG